jgi:hypothetical protein
LPFIGSLPRAARAISEIESSLSFQDKIPKAVWRGTTWFNNPRAGRLRQNLVRAFGNKRADSVPARSWADIESLDWATAGKSNSNSNSNSNSKDGGPGLGPGSGERNASNALRIEDFCRYKYIIHTEGVTYSGRFQFHNLCASVVITPPIAWMQHVTHLLRPVFSYTLDPSAPDSDTTATTTTTPNKRSPSRRSLRSLFSAAFQPSSSSLCSSTNNIAAGGAKNDKSPPNTKRDDASTTASKPAGLPRHPIDLGPGDKPAELSPYPAPWVRSAWPTEHDASEANIVFVAPDWSDLEATVEWLEAHPRVAEGIGRRQRSLFEDGGYFSPAAEMCYWRGLIRGWSEVVRVDEGAFDDLEEVTWEEFSLKEIHK